MKLDGIKPCREFVNDLLVMLGDDHSEDVIWPCDRHYANDYRFNWGGRTRVERQMRLSVFWLPRGHLFVAALCEKIPICVLRYGIDFLEHPGKWDRVNRWKTKMITFPASSAGGTTPASQGRARYQRQVAAEIGC